MKFINAINFEKPLKTTLGEVTVQIIGHQDDLTLDAADIELSCAAISFIDRQDELIVAIAASNIAYITTQRRGETDG